MWVLWLSKLPNNFHVGRDVQSNWAWFMSSYVTLAEFYNFFQKYWQRLWFKWMLANLTEMYLSNCWCNENCRVIAHKVSGETGKLKSKPSYTFNKSDFSVWYLKQKTQTQETLLITLAAGWIYLCCIEQVCCVMLLVAPCWVICIVCNDSADSRVTAQWEIYTGASRPVWENVW